METDEDTTKREIRTYAKLLCEQQFSCFPKLLRGSEYHAGHVSVEDVEYLIDIVEKTCDGGFPYIAAEIFSYFSQLLTYALILNPETYLLF